MLEHGGRLRAASRHWGIPLAEWIDLSTGIAPWPYPVQIGASAWQRLPEDEDELVAIAAAYYGHPAPLPLPGSQAAIRELPWLFPPGSAVLPAPTYGEYAPAWRAAGHEVREIASAELERAAAGARAGDIVMLANPNNPTAEHFPAERLLALAEQLAQRGAWLVVDEAFADAMPEHTLASRAGIANANLMVLRSLGKFFGLAGARVGFLCAAPLLAAHLAARLGPWAVAHPSRVAALQALGDRVWQTQQRRQLAVGTEALGRLLAQHGLDSAAGGELFRYTRCEAAAALHEHLARRGILVRHFDQPQARALRFGLPASEAQSQRLEQALDEWTR